MRETGQAIDKTNFLEIYGRAHIRALSPETICAAFRKTGVWQFNPDVVTNDMMAPSKETSGQGHLPVVPETPVRVIANLIRNISLADDSNDINKNPDEPDAPTPQETVPSTIHTAFDDAVQQLSYTQLAYLTSDSPVRSGAPNPHAHSQPVSPARAGALLIKPTTDVEICLLAALRESEDQVLALKQRVINLQASNILNKIYCNKLRFQLAYQERKKDSTVRGKLVGDGMPRLLSGDDFYEKVVEFTQWQSDKAERKDTRKQVKESLREAVELWKKDEILRKEENVAKTERYCTKIRAWEADKTEAKVQKHRFTVLKPKRDPLGKPQPRPKANVEVSEEVEGGTEQSDANDGEDDEDESDN